MLFRSTVTTGILPVKQVEICGEHVDFSQYQLCAAELNTVLAQKTGAQLPEFARGADYRLFYPADVLEVQDNGGRAVGKIKYEELPIVSKTLSMGEISGAESVIVDGMLAERRTQ